MIALDIILLVLAAAVAVPAAVLAFEVAASLLPRRKPHICTEEERPSVAVVVPAHNEEQLLPRTLASLQEGLREGDRLVVVADNCSDATAAVARQAGAECVERHDDQHRGKGYALDAGVKHLTASGSMPDVVVFNDADVVAAPGAVAMLACQVKRTGMPAQGCYLMTAPDLADRQDLVSRFALVLKNYVRPLGLDRMGLPCPLYGSGMGFPSSLARTMPLATGDLVEDMRLGLHLCKAGIGPRFCPQAEFLGELPADDGDAANQRRRWEHGHMSVLLATPALFAKGVLRASPRMIAAALDHAVQPLIVLASGLLVMAAIVGLRLLLGPTTTLAATASALSVGGLLLLTFAIAATWIGHLRGQIPASSLLGLPSYVVKRVPNQAAFVFRRQRDWVRTPARRRAPARRTRRRSAVSRTHGGPRRTIGPCRVRRFLIA